MTHFLKRCKVCGIVISQCRCRGHKTITWEICKVCKGNICICEHLHGIDDAILLDEKCPVHGKGKTNSTN